MSRLYSAVRIALCAIAVLNLGPVLSQSDAMERGRQWLELGNFDRARSEFMRAIELEPKNVEARYLIAVSYFSELKLVRATRWAVDALSVDPNYFKAEELLAEIVRETVRTLMTGTETDRWLGFLTAVQVADLWPSKGLVPGLRAALKEFSGEHRARVERVEQALARIDPAALRDAWIELLSDDIAANKAYAAERLWDTERYPPAAPILRDAVASELRSLVDGLGVRNRATRLLNRLLDLGWDEALPVIIELFGKGFMLDDLSAVLSDKSDERTLPLLQPLLTGDRSDVSRAAASTLAAIGSPAAIPALKDALEYYLFRRNQWGLPDHDYYVPPLAAALTNVAGQDWTAYNLLDSQHTFDRIAEALRTPESRRGQLAYRRAVSAHFGTDSPTYLALEAVISRIAAHGTEEGSSPSDIGLVPTRVEVGGPTSAKLHVAAWLPRQGWGDQLLGRVVLELTYTDPTWRVVGFEEIRSPEPSIIRFFAINYNLDRKYTSGLALTLIPGYTTEMSTYQAIILAGHRTSFYDGVYWSGSYTFPGPGDQLCFSVATISVDLLEGEVEGQVVGLGFSTVLLHGVFPSGDSTDERVVRKIRIGLDGFTVIEDAAACVEVRSAD